MENTTIKAFAAALIAAGTAVWGWMGWLVIAWLACMVMDYLTGSLAAATTCPPGHMQKVYTPLPSGR